MESVVGRAVELSVPITAHIDLTYRCNERCLHCYLHRGASAEMTTSEVADVLRQLAETGTLFLILSGGEIFLRTDALEIIAEARRLHFSVKLKTNASLLTHDIVTQMSSLGLQGVDVSIYSANPAIHDSITQLPGSLRKSLDAINHLHRAGIRVSICNVLMRENSEEVSAVRQLAQELGVGYTLDPMVTPMIDGNASVLRHRAEQDAIRKAFLEFNLSGRPGDDCPPLYDDLMQGIPCSAGHCQVYINPRGEVYPCVQFPVLCGDLKNQSFAEIWKSSPALAEVRAVRFQDLPVCSTCVHGAYCTRCPGLAWMEGDLRGPSSADCRKAEARTGIPPMYRHD